MSLVDVEVNGDHFVPRDDYDAVLAAAMVQEQALALTRFALDCAVRDAEEHPDGPIFSTDTQDAVSVARADVPTGGWIPPSVAERVWEAVARAQEVSDGSERERLLDEALDLLGRR